MPSRLVATDYAHLQNLITVHTGLSPDKHRQADIVRIVDNMMEAASLNGSQGLASLP